MSIILIFSDIHSNLPAFEAMLQDVEFYDVALCAGDIIGYYDSPNEVCNYIQEMHLTYSIRGNHEAYITGELLANPDHIFAYKLDWTRNYLSKKNMNWLQELANEVKIDVDGWKITMRHANPWDDERYVYPDSDALISKIVLKDREILILGHTHYPLIRNCGDGMLINPGSVGQPRDRDPRASYAIFDTQTGIAEVRRVSYNVGEYQRKLERQGWTQREIAILSRV